MRDWPCYWYQRKMTKDEFIEVMKNLDWKEDSIESIFQTVRDAVHWYDDELQEYYLSDFYNKEEAIDIVEDTMRQYGLSTAGTLLSKVKKFSEEGVYVYQAGRLENATKEDLKRVCDEIIKWVEEKGK